MMKKFFYLLAVLLLTSCSSKGTSDTDNSEANGETTEAVSSLEESTEPVTPVFGADGVYTPPFEITFVATGEDNFGQPIRQTNVFQLLANGRVKGHFTTEKYLFNTKTNEFDWFVKEDLTGDLSGGKWSSFSRRMGNGYQTIYEINTSGNKHSYYMPDDAEYIWGGQNGYYNCENYNTKDGSKIVEIKPID